MIGEVRKMQSYSFFILNSLNNQEYTTGKISRSGFFIFSRVMEWIFEPSESEPDLVKVITEVRSGRGEMDVRSFSPV